jgi:glyoxylase I family protein
MTALTGLHHVGLTVRDLDAAVEWYQRILGLEVLFEEHGDTRDAAVMAFPDGTFAVGLTCHSGNSTSFDPGHTGLDHVAFSVDSREAMADWEDRFTAADIEHSGAIDIPRGAILNFKDPDGIALALFWERA